MNKSPEVGNFNRLPEITDDSILPGELAERALAAVPDPSRLDAIQGSQDEQASRTDGTVSEGGWNG